MKTDEIERLFPESKKRTARNMKKVRYWLLYYNNINIFFINLKTVQQLRLIRILSNIFEKNLKGTYKITNSNAKTYPIDKTALNVKMLKFIQMFLMLR